MARSQAALTPDEIKEVASDVLTDRFKRFGFKAVTVGEDEDIDGTAILRMIAQVESSVPARDLIDTLDAVQMALHDRGEGRFVLLSTHIPGTEEPDEDEDE